MRKEEYKSTQEAFLTSSTNDQDAFNILVFMHFQDLHSFACLYQKRPKIRKRLEEENLVSNKSLDECINNEYVNNKI